MPPQAPQTNSRLSFQSTAAILLIIPSSLVLLFSILNGLYCYAACGLGGENFASKMFLQISVMFVLSLCSFILLLRIYKKSRKSIGKNAIEWSAVILLFIALLYLNQAQILFWATGNVKYTHYEYTQEVEKSKNMDCSTALDAEQEETCVAAKSDAYLIAKYEVRLYELVSSENNCGVFKNPYTQAACEIKTVMQDPYKNTSFCMDLDLKSSDKTTTEIDTLMPFIKYPTGTKESVRQHCLEHIFFNDPSYYNQVYAKGVIENRYIYGNQHETIPDYVFKEILDTCNTTTEPQLRDVCLASKADTVNYKSQFSGFCEKIGNSIVGLKENCVALRSQAGVK